MKTETEKNITIHKRSRIYLMLMKGKLYIIMKPPSIIHLSAYHDRRRVERSVGWWVVGSKRLGGHQTRIPTQHPGLGTLALPGSGLLVPWNHDNNLCHYFLLRNPFWLPFWNFLYGKFSKYIRLNLFHSFMYTDTHTHITHVTGYIPERGGDYNASKDGVDTDGVDEKPQKAAHTQSQHHREPHWRHCNENPT